LKRTRRVLLTIGILMTMVVGMLASGGVRPAQAVAGAVIDAKLQSALAGSQAPAEVIVTFNGDGAPTPAQVALLKQVGITQGLTMHALPIAGVLATKVQVDALAANPEVRSLYLNAPLQYYNAEATALTGVKRVRTDSTMTTRNGGLPVTGKGIGVVINDSGVDGTHSDLAFGPHLVQNTLGSTNLHSLVDLLPVTYTEGVPSTDTNSGHGTHVAGIVGGTGAKSAGKYEGVAPGAPLIGYGSGAALLILDGVGGFDYAITHQTQYGIRVITNSWGGSGDFNPADPVNVASYHAYKHNMVVTFAAGNSGPGENTHNPYAKAPWVISIAAGDKQGKLADFSSRGTKGVGGSFTMEGESWTWEDRPTVTAPGVNIISTRVIAPVTTLAAQEDVALIEPAYLPFYTTMSGTSMATPHAAGIVALMLEANPRLTPAQVKQIVQDTATNMPGLEPWEAGAGYINAYAAVDAAHGATGYGSTVNMKRSFNSSAQATATRTPFTVDYNPVTLASSNSYTFTVPAGLTELAARVDAYGVQGQTGNPINLVLIAPDGTESSSGTSLLFPLYTDRSVSVASPAAGTWTAQLRGLRGTADNPTGGAAVPEQVNGTITFRTTSGFTGLNDIAGNPAEGAIKMAIGERLMDGYAGGTFKPTADLTRRDLANYLVMGAEVRQYRPLDGSKTFSDVSAADLPYAEAVAAHGAAMRDQKQIAGGVMQAVGGSFAPTQAVRRADLAYSLVQSLGLESEAAARNGSPVTVQYGNDRIAIEDAADIPATLRGHVQIALDMNILNAYFYTTQGPYDLQPTTHATFKPLQKVSRADYAVAVVRFYSAYLSH
jgi:serine protease AprX